jgi:hypothetical protein
VEHDVTLISTVAIRCWRRSCAVRCSADRVAGHRRVLIAVSRRTLTRVSSSTTAAQQFVELGVIFMMFGGCISFDLSSVKRAVPGAVQMTLATGLGWWSPTSWLVHWASLVLDCDLDRQHGGAPARPCRPRLLSGGKTAVGWLIRGPATVDPRAPARSSTSGCRWW